MKKYILVFCLLSGVSMAQAQALRVGLKGGPNSTWLLNDNIFGSADINIWPTFGGTVGPSVTYMFSDAVGVSLDILYTSVNQQYRPDEDEDPFAYDLKEKLRYIDLPLLFKVGSQKGPYFEIGPKFSILTKHREEFTFLNGVQGGQGESYSNKSDFNGLLFSIALGFGVDIKIVKNMYINAGLRLAYNPGDVLRQKSSAELMLDGDNHTIIQQFSSYSNYPDKASDLNYRYKKTHLVSGGLFLGFTYQIFGDDE